MIEDALPFETMVFVCTHQRAAGERTACANAGRDGSAIAEALKRAVEERGWKGRVRVCKSGCLDRCEEGPNAVVVRPDGKPRWFHAVSQEDLTPLLDRCDPLNF